MKKILVLGATTYQIPLIKLARQMGFFVITSDNFIGNPGHKYADDSVEISTVDAEKILNYSKSAGIDGIITGGSDAAISTIGFVCENLGLPGITYKQGNILTKKNLFRQFQKENGINFPEFFILNNIDEFTDLKEELEGFYVIKPVDRSGSIDVQIIEFPIRKGGLIRATNYFNNAIKSSIIHKAILEKYIDGTEYGGDLFVKNNEIISFCLTNKFLLSKSKRIPIGHTLPVKLGQEKQNTIKNSLHNIINKLDIKNGPFNFDVMLVEKKDVIVLEMSPRFGGNCIPEIIKYSTGFDEVKESIRFAMGMPLNTPIINNNLPVGARIIRSDFDGTLKYIKPLKDIKNKYHDYIKKIVFDYKIGDFIYKFDQSNKRLGHFIITADTLENVEYIIEDIEKDIVIRV